MHMRYDWAGSSIIFDTYVEQLRWIPKDALTDDMRDDNPNMYIRTDLRDMIAPASNWEMKEILEFLIDKRKLPTRLGRGLFDTCALICWRWTRESIMPARDMAHRDFWQRPAETYVRAKGDCEDSTLILTSLLLAAGVSPYNVRATIGRVVNDNHGEIGHAWVMYKDEAGRWLILDPSIDPLELPADAADLASVRPPYSMYVPVYCFNRDHVWSVGGVHDRDETAAGRDRPN